MKVVSGTVLILLFVSLFASVFDIQSVKAKTIIVGPDGYPTIQLAVDAASSGDTIIVRAGTYIENVYVNKDDLTIKSESGAGVTIVQAADPDGNVFQVVRLDYVTIDGFTLKDATGKGDGIFFWNCSHGQVKNCIVMNNEYGITIGPSSTDMIVEGNTAIGNRVNGIDFFDSSDIVARGNDCSLNKAAGFKVTNSSGEITSNIVTGNLEYGIYLYQSSSNRIYGNTFVDNVQQAGVTAGYANTWDNGYPSGGNYWSDHNPPDIDMDKIGDLPYTIDENNTDQHPLVYPFEFYEPGYVCSPDANNDGIVNIVDVSRVARAFGCVPGHTNWSPTVDMDLNEIINILDVAMVAKDYGKTA